LRGRARIARSSLAKLQPWNDLARDVKYSRASAGYRARAIPRVYSSVDGFLLEARDGATPGRD